ELLHPEVTTDWASFPFSDLDSDCIAHLDAEGLRYYLPALMLALLEHYDSGSMRVIGTIGALNPHSAYGDDRLKLLTEKQGRAIAAFLASLPKLVDLHSEDLKIVSLSLESYWVRYTDQTCPQAALSSPSSL